MNVSKKNKINYYILKDNGLGQENAVNDIMRLFGINYNNDENLLQMQTIPFDVVVIKHDLSDNILCMEVIYWQDNNLRQKVERQSVLASNKVLYRKELNRLIKVNLLKVMRTITGYDPGPWGILKGVKPTKLVNRFIDEGMDQQAVIKLLMNNYSVEYEKAHLVSDIALRQRNFIPTVEKPAKNVVSIYVGIPFCPSKCLYCSFPSYVRPNSREVIALFIKKLARDIEEVANIVDRYGLLVQNVYVGGGTPTSLQGNDFAWLLGTIKDAFISDFTREFTVEAGRPDSINDEHIDIMKRLCVSRVSVNPQTMQEKTLKHIGRQHTIQDIIDVFYRMRNARIPIINMDIIAGLPGETAKDMENTMQQIAQLNPDNLTVHTLAIKKGSVLKEHLAEYPLPNDFETREMLQIAAEYATILQMHPYYLYRQKYMTGNMENIGYSKAGMECLYNMQILEERQTVIGMGPAAATKAVNTANWHLDSFYHPKDLKTYIENLDRFLEGRRRILTELFCNGKGD